MSDVAEGLAAARLVGEKVVVIEISTGGTLVAATEQDPDLMANVVGVVFVSPNFGINNRAAAMPTLPAVHDLLPL